MNFPFAAILGLFSLAGCFDAGFYLLKFQQPYLSVLPQIIASKVLDHLNDLEMNFVQPVILFHQNVRRFV